MANLPEIDGESTQSTLHETVFSYRYRRNTTKKSIVLQSIQDIRPGSAAKHVILGLIDRISRVIHPLSRFKLTWERLIWILVVLNSMVIPWQVAFRLNQGCSQDVDDFEDTCISGTERIVAVFIDAIFWIDIIISFRSGYVDNRMVIHMNPREIIVQYCKTFFPVDLIANFPYYNIASSLARSGRFERHVAMNLYVLPKILRIGRLFRRSTGSKFASSFSRLGKMVSGFLMASHWCGCIWYFIGRWEAESVGANRFTGGVSWIEVPLSEDGSTYQKADLRTKYTAAIYWAITTMSTVGYGDISPQTNIERIFTMVVMLLGATSTAIILGNVAVLIANFTSSSQKLRDKRYQLDEYLRARGISGDLCRRARTSLQFSWDLQRGMSHEEILQDVPQNIKTDILLHIHTTAIRRSFLFSGCDDQFTRALVSKLRPEAYAPGEVIYYEGDKVDKMCLIRSGKAKVLRQSEGVVFDVLSEGDLFGEVEFFGDCRRRATIQALTAVDVQSLSKESFDQLLVDFPEYWEIMERLCLKKREEFEDRLDQLRPVGEREFSNTTLQTEQGGVECQMPDNVLNPEINEGLHIDQLSDMSPALSFQSQIIRLEENLIAIASLYQRQFLGLGSDG